MDILGTIWVLRREPREAGEASREEQPWQEQRGGEQREALREIQAKARGQRVQALRKGGFLPPSQALSPVGLPLCSLALPWISRMTRFPPSPSLAKSLSPTGCVAGSVCSGNVC